MTRAKRLFVMITALTLSCCVAVIAASANRVSAAMRVPMHGNLGTDEWRFTGVTKGRGCGLSYPARVFVDHSPWNNTVPEPSDARNSLPLDISTIGVMRCDATGSPDLFGGRGLFTAGSVAGSIQAEHTRNYFKYLKPQLPVSHGEVYLTGADCRMSDAGGIATKVSCESFAETGFAKGSGDILIPCAAGVITNNIQTLPVGERPPAEFRTTPVSHDVENPVTSTVVPIPLSHVRGFLDVPGDIRARAEVYLAGETTRIKCLSDECLKFGDLTDDNVMRTNLGTRHAGAGLATVGVAGHCRAVIGSELWATGTRSSEDRHWVRDVAHAGLDYMERGVRRIGGVGVVLDRNRERDCQIAICPAEGGHSTDNHTVRPIEISATMTMRFQVAEEEVASEGCPTSAGSGMQQMAATRSGDTLQCMPSDASFRAAPGSALDGDILSGGSFAPLKAANLTAPTHAALGRVTRG